MKEISDSDGGQNLQLEECLSCLLENLALNLDYSQLINIKESQIKSTTKKKMYLEVLSGVLVKNYNNYREKVKMETINTIREIELTKNLFISSIPQELLNIKMNDLLLSLSNSKISKENNENMKNYNDELEEIKRNNFSLGEKYKENISNIVFDLDSLNSQINKKDKEIITPLLNIHPSINHNFSNSNPFIKPDNLNPLVLTSNSNIKKTPKVKKHGFGNTNGNSDSDYNSDHNIQTPGFKANSQKEFKNGNLKIKNNERTNESNSKHDSILKIQKLNTFQNKKNYSEIYRSPSPVPSKKYKSKYLKDKENNGGALMTPVKK